MATVARGGLVVLVVVAGVALAFSFRNMAAKPSIHFDSLESRCNSSWPDENAVARVLRSVSAEGQGRISQTPIEWIGPAGGVLASFAPIPILLDGRFGPTIAFYANGAAVKNDSKNRGGFIALKVRTPEVLPRFAKSRFTKSWSDYRWFEFHASDTEPVCTWLSI